MPGHTSKLHQLPSLTLKHYSSKLYIHLNKLMSSKNLFLFTGQNRSALLAELKKWQQAFTEKFGNTDIDIYQDSINSNDLLTISQTMPLFSDKRLIIIHDFFSKHKKDLDPDFISNLAQKNQDNIIVFIESESPDKRLKTTKELLKLITHKEFNSTDLYLKNQLNLPTELVNELELAFHGHEHLLPKELEKLQTYIDNDSIQPKPTTQELHALINWPINTNVFKLTDLLFDKNNKAKLKTLTELYQAGEDIYRLIYLLANQTRLLLLLKLNNGNTQILTTLKVHPFVQKKLSQKIHQISLSSLKNFYKSLYELDKKIKTGQIKTGSKNDLELIFALEKILIAD